MYILLTPYQEWWENTVALFRTSGLPEVSRFGGRLRLMILGGFSKK